MRCRRIQSHSPLGLGLTLTLHRNQSTLNSKLTPILKARKLPILYDYLTPQPSHLLTTTLDSFLPFLSTNDNTHIPSSPEIPLPSTIHNPVPLAPGYHLVYFPPATDLNSLLQDGTDTLHSPGPPYTHRLWSGGHVRFPRRKEREPFPLLNGRRAAMVERICDVRVSGREGEGEDKVFVGIERRAGIVGEGEDEGEIRRRLGGAEGNEVDEDDDVFVIERRDLCFLRPPCDRTILKQQQHQQDQQQRHQQHRPQKVSRHHQNHNHDHSHHDQDPSFTHPLPPITHPLLFRYSALTYNAHTIHLDVLHTRSQYQQPDLLAHGPLLLTLLLTSLEHELGKAKSKGTATSKGVPATAQTSSAEKRKTKATTTTTTTTMMMIRDVRYRCLRPLFVGEEAVRIRGVRKEDKEKLMRRRRRRKRDEVGVHVDRELEGSSLLRSKEVQVETENDNDNDHDDHDDHDDDVTEEGEEWHLWIEKPAPPPPTPGLRYEASRTKDNNNSTNNNNNKSIDDMPTTTTTTIDHQSRAGNESRDAAAAAASYVLVIRATVRLEKVPLSCL